MQSAPEWSSSLFLDPGEVVVGSWPGNRETEGLGTVRGEMKTVKNVQSGILVLTDQKLVWIDKKGTIGKSYIPRFTIRLENVRGISMGGTVFKHILISDGETTYKFYVVKEKEFPGFQRGLMNQISRRTAALDSQKKQERVHIMLDFSFLKQYMEKGGLMLQSVKCTNCGAPMKMPDTGNTVTCDHCHAQNRVEDIFEKVKSLIG